MGGGAVKWFSSRSEGQGWRRVVPGGLLLERCGGRKGKGQSRKRVVHVGCCQAAVPQVSIR
jgi:hypothetical protein